MRNLDQGSPAELWYNSAIYVILLVSSVSFAFWLDVFVLFFTCDCQNRHKSQRSKYPLGWHWLCTTKIKLPHITLDFELWWSFQMLQGWSCRFLLSWWGCKSWSRGVVHYFSSLSTGTKPKGANRASTIMSFKKQEDAQQWRQVCVTGIRAIFHSV